MILWCRRAPHSWRHWAGYLVGQGPHLISNINSIMASDGQLACQKRCREHHFIWRRVRPGSPTRPNGHPNSPSIPGQTPSTPSPAISQEPNRSRVIGAIFVAHLALLSNHPRPSQTAPLLGASMMLFKKLLKRDMILGISRFYLVDVGCASFFLGIEVIDCPASLHPWQCPSGKRASSSDREQFGATASWCTYGNFAHGRY